MKGDISVWNLNDNMLLIDKWDINQQIYCMNVITIHHKQNIWIGTGNEILILERKKGFVRRLKMPKEGNVICMENVGIDIVCISIKGKNGSLYEWQFI